jgi:hypothetical protein
MPSTKTDPIGFNSPNADEERDEAAKGGPSIGLGIADGKHSISHPYQADLQTQIAAKSHKKRANPVTTPSEK